MALCLTRRLGERLLFYRNDELLASVTLANWRGNAAQLRVDAPDDVRIVRGELNEENDDDSSVA